MPRPSGSQESRELSQDCEWRSAGRYRWSAFGIAACLLLAAIPVVKATIGITYPHDVDQFRDIAAAQVVADGRPLADPFYAGETVWYNPLMALTVGGFSVLTNTPVPAASIMFGVLFNTLVVVLFVAVATMLAGPWSALIAVAFVLFCQSYIGLWVTPGYSPWLFATNFASALFYVGLLLCSSTGPGSRSWRWAAIGLALGLTFLAHTAPALILGICVLVTIHTVSANAATALRRLFTVGIVALVISAPFLWSIGFRYRFKIDNWDPTSWVWPPSDVSVAPALILSTLTIQNALAAYGLFLLARGARRALQPRLILSWFCAAVALFVYGWIQQAYSRQLPAVVPQFHFYFYVRAAAYLASGVGTWRLIHGVTLLVARNKLPALFPFLTTAFLSLGFAAVQYPKFLQREDFHGYVTRAVAMTEEFSATRLRERLRTETGYDAVILAGPTDSLFRIGTSGRRVVAVKTEFSNPYVSSERRLAAQIEMMTAFIHHDLVRFWPLADKYHVTHVLLGEEDAVTFDSLPALAEAQQISTGGGYVLLKLYKFPLEQTPAARVRGQ